jgi:hypothetical protein
MTRALLHPRAFTAGLVNHFAQRCTIFERGNTLDEAGQPDIDWTPLAGHQDIPCVKGSLPGQANQSERRRFGYTASIDEQSVLLRGYWPDITDTMRARIDGVNYSITGVDHESQAALTRIRIEHLK